MQNKSLVTSISETKIDESFPVANILLPGFSVPYRSESNSKGGGIVLYVPGDIPSNLLSIENKPISIDEIVDCKIILKSIRGDNKHKLIFAHLSINSIRNKSDALAEQVAGNIDFRNKN